MSEPILVPFQMARALILSTIWPETFSSGSMIVLIATTTGIPPDKTHKGQFNANTNTGYSEGDIPGRLYPMIQSVLPTG